VWYQDTISVLLANINFILALSDKIWPQEMVIRDGKCAFSLNSYSIGSLSHPVSLQQFVQQYFFVVWWFNIYNCKQFLKNLSNDSSDQNSWPIRFKKFGLRAQMFWATSKKWENNTLLFSLSAAKFSHQVCKNKLPFHENFHIFFVLLLLEFPPFFFFV
jgi:hypothetical protein